MKVLFKASWEDQAKLPELAARVASIFGNPPEGIKRISSYGVIGGKEVYSIYEVEDPIALTTYVSMIGTVGFGTKVLPLIDTDAGIKAVLEGAQSLKSG
jgi:uncharacterized protein with GYD domain